MDPVDFMISASAAKVCYDNDKHEAHLRTSVSRAYYAAFHVAKRVSEEHKITVGCGGNEHNALISALKKHQIKGLRTLGNQLDVLRAKRVIADYKMDKHTSVSDCKTALRDAQNIISTHA